MKRTERRQTSGAGLVEVLVALSVTGLLAVVGMQALAGHLNGILLDERRHQERRLLTGLQEEIQRAFDSRLSHQLDPDPWLWIEGRPASQGTRLTKLRLRIVEWNGSWRIREWRDSPNGWTDDSVPLGYRGRIFVSSPSGAYAFGDQPFPIRFSFPDFLTGQGRQGFAIFRHW